MPARWLLMLGILLFLLAGPLWAAPPIAPSLTQYEKIAAPAQYPDSPALILRDEVDFAVLADGSQELVQHEIIKVFNTTGIRRYGQVTVPFTSGFQQVTLISARMLTPGEKERDLDIAQGKAERLFEDEPDSPYANLMEFRFDFPNPKVGDILEYTVRITTPRPVIAGEFWESSYTREIAPMALSRFRVILPQNRTFRTGFYGMQPTAAQVIRESGRVIYQWQVKDTAPIPVEPAMPAFSDLSSRITATSLSSWDKVGQWFAHLVSDRIRSTPTVQAAVAEAVLDRQSPEDKAGAIYTYVATNIRSVDLEFAGYNYLPNNAGEVILQKAGNSLDKSVLLTAMLRQAGLEAEPVLISSTRNGRVLLDAPFPFAFDQVITRVRLNGSWTWLAPMAASIPFGSLPAEFQGRQALVATNQGYEIIETPLSAAADNQEITQAEAMVSEQGDLTETLVLEMTGINAQLIRDLLAPMSENKALQVYARLIRLVSEDAEIVDGRTGNLKELDRPLKITLRLQADGFARKAGNLLILKLPLFPIQKLMVFREDGAEGRQTSLELNNASSEERRLHIVLPEGYRVKASPDLASLENRVGSYMETWKSGQGEVWYTSKLVINRGNVPVGSYGDFLALVKATSRSDSSLLVIEKTGQNGSSAGRN